jgi:DNA-binding transcriptional ArsR family regulator
MERMKTVAAKKPSRAKASKPKRKRKAVGAKTAARDTASRTIDQKLIKALAHPMRVEILAILNDRTASPNELSKELEEGLSQVSYHIKVLKDFKCIQMVRTEPRRGAVEHYYKATQRAFLTSDIVTKLPKSAQQRMFGTVLSDISEDMRTALDTGDFDKRKDYVVSRVPATMDGKGREDAEKLGDEFIERYLLIDEESALRRCKGEGDGEEIPTTAVLLVFGSVLGKALKAARKKGRKK